MKLFCKHDWEILQEITTESKAEQRIRLVGSIPSERNSLDFDMFFKKKHMTILKCNTCGNLKRYVEEI